MKKKTTSHTDKEISPPPDPRTEKDIDELVHLKKEEKPIEEGEEDPDDMVHRQYKLKASEDNMEDPDDLVHDSTEEDD